MSVSDNEAKKARAVFLDRDGVLNRSDVRDGKPYAPRHLKDFHLYEDAEPSLRALRSSGFRLIVVTNQPDIGNGLADRSEIDAMHERLSATGLIDDIYVCMHRQDEGCDCRKPKPGMLLDAAAKHSIKLADSYMIGDRKGDVQAGKLSGAKTIFIDRGYRESEQTEDADWRVSSLSEAVDIILSRASAA